MNPIIKNIIHKKFYEKLEKKYRKFVSMNLIPYRYSFELHNVNIAVANGIRRTLLVETINKAMTFELSTFVCTSPYMLNNFVHDRIMSIPILQSTSSDVVFELNVTNDEATRVENLVSLYQHTVKEAPSKEEIDDVKKPQDLLIRSGFIKQIAGKKLTSIPFNETYEVAILPSGTSITIPAITITEGYGWQHCGFAQNALVYCKPLDQIPLDLLSDKPQKNAISVSESDPRVHEIGFTNNGTLEPHQAVIRACKSLEERLIFIRGLRDEITSILNEHTLEILGETDTIGNLLMKTISDTESVECVTYLVDSFVRKVTIKIKTSSDVKKMLDRCIQLLIDTVKAIENSF